MCYVYHFYSLLTYCVIEISAVWYVLPYEAIGVFDTTYLSWCMRIGKGIFAIRQFLCEHLRPVCVYVSSGADSSCTGFHH